MMGQRKWDLQRGEALLCILFMHQRKAGVRVLPLLVTSSGCRLSLKAAAAFH